jgi:hypothetical protein
MTVFWVLCPEHRYHNDLCRHCITSRDINQRQLDALERARA